MTLEAVYRAGLYILCGSSLLHVAEHVLRPWWWSLFASYVQLGFPVLLYIFILYIEETNPIDVVKCHFGHILKSFIEGV